MPCLKLTVDEGKPKLHPIYKKVTAIGSAAVNDIVLQGDNIAEYHAQIVFDGRYFNLSEVDPHGPLFINGKKKRRGRLSHHDTIGVGDFELTFSLFDEVSSTAHEREQDFHAEIGGLNKLFEFSQRLMEKQSLSDLLDALMDSVIELTHADKGFLVLLHGEQPQVTVARNVQKETLSDGIRHLSDSILAKVIETRQPLIVSDALSHDEFKSSESVMHLKLCSVMCAPLISQGELLGIIYVGNDSVRNLFEQSSLDVLRIFAAQASLILQNALVLNQLKTDRDQLEDQLHAKQFGDIVGSSPALLEVFSKVKKIASTDVSVLVTGETGTGKELVANELHRRSQRAKGPFVVINCGAIPENLMESELFGHVRGAFTGAVATRQGRFQAANGGTLFLDEIGEMPLALQVKLLRALQERVVTKVGDTKSESVDIRVIAATNRDLNDEIKAGNFREDLYYRLNVVQLLLPPLRDRGDDTVVLAKYLLQKYTKEFGRDIRGFTPNALIAIKKYQWPGNVRQLENRIKKAVVLCDKSLIGPDDLELFPETLTPIQSLADAREDFQRRYILEVLDRNNGNRTKTARDLGVDPRTIFRYLEKEPTSSGVGKSAKTEM